jgi:hypothetical protein
MNAFKVPERLIGFQGYKIEPEKVFISNNFRRHHIFNRLMFDF